MKRGLAAIATLGGALLGAALGALLPLIVESLLPNEGMSVPERSARGIDIVQWVPFTAIIGLIAGILVARRLVARPATDSSNSPVS